MTNLQLGTASSDQWILPPQMDQSGQHNDIQNIRMHRTGEVESNTLICSGLQPHHKIIFQETYNVSPNRQWNSTQESICKTRGRGCHDAAFAKILKYHISHFSKTLLGTFESDA